MPHRRQKTLVSIRKNVNDGRDFFSFRTGEVSFCSRVYDVAVSEGPTST